MIDFLRQGRGARKRHSCVLDCKAMAGNPARLRQAIRQGYGRQSGKATAGNPARLRPAIRQGYGRQSGKGGVTITLAWNDALQNRKGWKISELKNATPLASSHAQCNRIDEPTHGTSPRELRSQVHLRLPFTWSEEAHPMRTIRHTPSRRE